MTISRYPLAIYSVLFFFFASAAVADSTINSKKCLLVMSYHSGYAWNDGIEAGVEQTLMNKCQLKKFFMDTKRNTKVEFAKKMALQAKLLIESYQPDIVIASDDNASRYLIQPYYKDNPLPFIFCGINWTAEAYGYPYSNVTGMVEVAPILPLLSIIKNNISNVNNGIYLSADVITEHKDFHHYKQEYSKHGINLQAIFVSTMAQWKTAYNNAQNADFIIVNNYAGINDWDEQQAVKHVKNNSTKLTVTNYKWMMPYAMLGLTKNAFEQGRWSSEVAISILAGADITEIPITINKEWHMFVNEGLLRQANITLDKHTMRRASQQW